MVNLDTVAIALNIATEKRLRAEIKAAKMSGPTGPQGKKGLDGVGIAGKAGPLGQKGNSVKGQKGDTGQRGTGGQRGIQGQIGRDGSNGHQGKQGPQGERGPQGLQGLQGPKGPALKHKWDGTQLQIENPNGEWGKKVNLAGRSGVNTFVGGKGGGGGKPASGIATIDFSDGAKTATTTINSVPSVKENSVIVAQMRIESTDQHSVDDLLIDPIAVYAYEIIAGVGFTILGTMQNARANGKYKVEWAVM